MSKQIKRLKVLVHIMRVLTVASLLMVIGAAGMLQWHQITGMEFFLRSAFFLILTFILGSVENYLTNQLRKNIRRERKLKVISK